MIKRIWYNAFAENSCTPVFARGAVQILRHAKATTAHTIAKMSQNQRAYFLPISSSVIHLSFREKTCIPITHNISFMLPVPVCNFLKLFYIFRKKTPERSFLRPGMKNLGFYRLFYDALSVKRCLGCCQSCDRHTEG